jgi:hypothetical protein
LICGLTYKHEETVNAESLNGLQATRLEYNYKTEFKDGSVFFSESFDPDDPSLLDRYPDYTTETDLGDRPPTPTQQRDVNSKRKACKSLNGLQATRLEYNLGLVVLCKFYVRVTLSSIAYRFVFFLQAFRLLFTSRCCVGVGEKLRSILK